MFLDCTLLTWQLEKSPIGVASLGSNRPRKFVAAMASSTPFGGGVAAANGMVKLTMCIHDHPWFSQGNPRMPWLIMAYHGLSSCKTGPEFPSWPGNDLRRRIFNNSYDSILIRDSTYGAPRVVISQGLDGEPALNS